MKKKLQDNEKKQGCSIRLHPTIMHKLNETQSNKSKYIEYLIYLDMRKNNVIDRDLML